MPDRHNLAGIPAFFWSLLQNPVFLISLLLPTFVHVAFNAAILDSFLQDSSQSGYKVNDLTIDMMFEWQLQLTTLICAEALLLITLIPWLIGCHFDANKKKPMKELVDNSRAFVIFFMFPLMVSIVIFVFLVMGTFGSINTIEIYRATNSVFENDLSIPPINSSISWGRLFLMLGAISFSLAHKNFEEFRHSKNY